MSPTSSRRFSRSSSRKCSRSRLVRPAGFFFGRGEAVARVLTAADEADALVVFRLAAVRVVVFPVTFLEVLTVLGAADLVAVFLAVLADAALTLPRFEDAFLATRLSSFRDLKVMI